MIWQLACAALSGSLITITAPKITRKLHNKHPINMFEGRMFPHPVDPDWQVSRGRAELGKIVLSRKGTYDGRTWTYLAVDDVEIANGARAEIYLRVIEKAANARQIAKVLELLP